MLNMLFNFLFNKFSSTHNLCQCTKNDFKRCTNKSKFQAKYIHSGKIKTIYCCGVHVRQLLKKPLISVLIKRNDNTYALYHHILIQYESCTVPENFVRPFIHRCIDHMSKIMNEVPFVNKDQIDVCTICLESIDKFNSSRRKKMSCNHVFHKCCIQKWLQKNNTCPNCREYVAITCDA